MSIIPYFAGFCQGGVRFLDHCFLKVDRFLDDEICKGVRFFDHPNCKSVRFLDDVANATGADTVPTTKYIIWTARIGAFYATVSLGRRG